MKKNMVVTGMVTLSLVMVGCAQKKNEETKASSSINTKITKEKTEDLGFKYDDQDVWEQVSGKMQSPIDIPDSLAETMKDEGSIKLNYSSKITKAENTGHSIQVTNSGSAVINQRNFELKQFHFHAQSEHTIEGKHYPMEAHFVNQGQDGRLAVIAIFFEEGTENKGFQEVLEDVTDGKKTEILDLESMFPSNLSYYHYLGSLTTPPLTENAEWYILKNTVQVSKEQIDTFKQYYDHNNRQVQPLNDRVILSHDQ